MKVAPSSPGEVYLTIAIVGVGLLIQIAVSALILGGCGQPTGTFRIIRGFASNVALIHSLTEKAEQSNNNGRDADNAPEWRRRRLTRDDPDDANADYSERNKIGEHRVAHRSNPFRADADL